MTAIEDKDAPSSEGVSISGNDLKKSSSVGDLIRRGWNTPRTRTAVMDQITKKLRPAVRELDLRPPNDTRLHHEEGLSGNLERLLHAAGLPSDYSLDPDKAYGFRIYEAFCVSKGLKIIEDPVAENVSAGISANPFHGMLMGLLPIKLQDPDRYENLLMELAKASEVITTPKKIISSEG